MSNHVIIRLIRFVLRFTIYLCNVIYFFDYIYYIMQIIYKNFIFYILESKQNPSRLLMRMPRIQFQYGRFRECASMISSTTKCSSVVLASAPVTSASLRVHRVSVCVPMVRACVRSCGPIHIPGSINLFSKKIFYSARRYFILYI